MKNWRIEAIIIAIGIIMLGVMIRNGINDFREKDRVVTVKGLAEMEVPADKVVWPLMYKDIGNDPAVLYANLEQKNKAIVQFLKSNGISDDEISIAPPEVIDMQAERYADRNVNYRYNATSVITVTSKNVDKVRKLMSEQAELMKQGITITGGDYRYNVVYEFTGLNEVKPQTRMHGPRLKNLPKTRTASWVRYGMRRRGSLRLPIVTPIHLILKVYVW